MLIFAVYFGARTYGFHYDNVDALSLGADWLAIGASEYHGVPPKAKGSRPMTTGWNRRGLDLPEIGIRHPRQQPNGPEYSLDVDRILFLDGYRDLLLLG